MKKLLLVINLVFIILLVVFSIQNAKAVPVTFWAWKVEVSLALLMILCVVLGVVLSLMVNVFHSDNDKTESPNKTDNSKQHIQDQNRDV